jgi:spore coat protein B
MLLPQFIFYEKQGEFIKTISLHDTYSYRESNYIGGKSMNKGMLKSWVGKVIKVDRGGGESRTGKLIGAEEDHFILLTKEDGVIYYPTHHVKSLTENTKKGFDFNVELPEDFEFKTSSTFRELLDSLNYHWVKVNRGGHEKLEGVLIDSQDDFITMVLNDEVIRIAMFHIRNISYGPKMDNNKNDESKKEDNKAEDKKDK